MSPPKKSKAKKRVVPPPHVEESYEESNEKKFVHVAKIFLIVFSKSSFVSFIYTSSTS